MYEIIKNILDKLKQCDDFHNRCDCLLEHDEITYLLEYIEEKDKEIEILNNIINELEHDFESYELEYLQDTYQGSLADFIETELERIQELKGSDKKEKTITDNNTMVDVKGNNFHCTCGANVFTRYSDDTFECHGCGKEYKGE